MTKMERDMGKLYMYRVYGRDKGENIFDEYVWAMSAQHAVDRVREWHGHDADGYVALEVSKVVKGWK